jgi:hypothetical protein
LDIGLISLGWLKSGTVLVEATDVLRGDATAGRAIRTAGVTAVVVSQLVPQNEGDLLVERNFCRASLRGSSACGSEGIRRAAQSPSSVRALR